MSHPVLLTFMESELEAGAEAEIPEEKVVPIFPFPPHVTDPDDEENIDHE